MQNFNDIEALKIATEIEKRGADIYTRALKIAKKPDVRDMLTRLRNDEIQHAATFERLGELALKNVDDAEYYTPEASMFLSAFAAEIAFPGGLIKLATESGLDDPKVILEQAIQAEKNSILFYQEIMDASGNSDMKKYLADIVREERSHLMGLLTQMSKMG